MIGWHDRLVTASGRQIDRYFTDSLGPVGSASRESAELTESTECTEAGTNPYGGFNLGAHVGDATDRVAHHRSLLAAEVRLAPERFVWMNQVHGAQVVAVDAPLTQPIAAADGIFTEQDDLALTVLVADCTPVLLADQERGLIAAVHAGRPGMSAGIVPSAVRHLRAQGAAHLTAVVGPSVCGRCYEVPPDLRDQAARASAASVAVSWTGTPAVDVAAGVVDQLQREGVEVTWLPGCTREREDLYSYRRQQRTGRFAGVIVLRGPDRAPEGAHAQG